MNVGRSFANLGLALRKKAHEVEEAELGRLATHRRASFIGAPLGEEVPRLVADCVEALRSRVNAEGLFRESGNKDRVNQLMLEYKGGKSPELAKESAATIAGLLKAFLTQLQPPLLGVCDGNFGTGVDGAMERLSSLNPGNLHILRVLLPLLSAVSRNATSKMNPVALGLSLFCMFGVASQDKAAIEKCTGFISLLIENADNVENKLGNLPSRNTT